MGDFEDKLNKINKNNIKNFLENLKKPCFETELIKLAFNDKNILNTDALTLYQNHFILFYFLYKLQEEYYKENKYLHIHFMRTFLLPYPENGFCRFYYEDNGKFCNSQTVENSMYCKHHLNLIGTTEIEILSTKYFYLDIDNYYKLNKETAEQFINGTWEILTNFSEIKKSFEILDIPETYDLELIKNQFKYLAKKYHPDLGEISHKKFNEINNAYRLLIKYIPALKK